MIAYMRIKHRALKRFWETGNPRGLPAIMTARLNRRLDRLADAVAPTDLDLPGYRLHPLTGDLAGWWSIRVTVNWRLIFRFADGEAVDVDLVDYH